MEKFIVNPAYEMRQDGNRVVIASRGLLDPDIYDYAEHYSYIHPINAQMLSFFNGDDDLGTVIDKISHHFNIPTNKTKEIVEKYIENNEKFTTPSKAGSQSFPYKTIVKKGNFKNYKVYKTTDFVHTDTPDFMTFRAVIPTNLNIQLTMKCYTDCIYCYANRKMNIIKPLSFDKIIETIREARRIGIIDLMINGGEVLLHPQYKEIILEMIKCGYEPYISTKVPLTQSIVNNLAEIGLKRIQISLDTVNPNLLKKMVNVNLDYLKLMEASIQRLQNAGIKIMIHTIVTSVNSDLNEMEKLLEFVSKYETIKSVKFTAVGPSLYKSPENHQQLKPTNKYLRELSEWCKNKKEKYPDLKIIAPGEWSEEDFRDPIKFNKRSFCSANTIGMVILPDGRVTVCEELYEDPRFIIGDINDNSLLEIWQSEKAKKLLYLKQEDFPDDSPCKKCKSFNNCRYKAGVCWKFIFETYGEDKFYYPDPRCPESPEYKYKIFYE